VSREGTILLVDDEEYVRDSLAALLERRGFDVRRAGSAEEALARHELEGIDAVLTDLRMPGADGLDLLRRLAAAAPALPVIVLTGHGTVASAVECVRAGAREYLLKPVDPEALVLLLRRILREAGTRRELEYLRAGAEDPPRERLLGVSDVWRRVLEEAELAAGSDAPVLVQGESGTGKEEIARFVHARSRRRDGPMVGVNCAAIPLELFESEFFGHRKGAFTGAVEDRVGRWKVADRGTLFLDEINSLPRVAQPKVLRALQDGVFERVGDSRPTSADVRVVCASNVDLAAEVEAGRFRRDLFYRINVLTLCIPPLRERLADVPVLANAFLRELAARNGKTIQGFEDATMDAMIRYAWPGNVRELRNVVERGVLLETSGALRARSLPADVAAASSGAGRGAVAATARAAARDGTDLNLRAHLRAEEKRVLTEALRRAGDVRREAARLLGIDERNLSYYLRKHGIGGSATPEG
jgi:two-component system response regulator HydG